MYCGECGLRLEEGKSCPRCAAAILSVPTYVAAMQPSNNKQKVGMFIVIAIIALMMLVLWQREQDNQSTPKKAVEGLFQALKMHDVKKMISYLTEEYRPNKDSLVLTSQVIKQKLGELDFRIEDYEILDIEQDGERAEVEYSVTYRIDRERDYDEGYFDLIKLKGKWYIDQSFEFEHDFIDYIES